MIKKIIELKDDTEVIKLSEYSSVDEKSNNYTSSEQEVFVRDLPNVIERQVFKLSQDKIEELEDYKRQFPEFISFIREMDIIDDVRDYLVPTYTFYEAIEVAAAFYLGYIDLVPTKEPKFMVEVDMHDQYGNLKSAHAWRNNRHGGVTPYIDEGKLPSTYYNYNKFLENEADKIVRGLSALNARKVLVNEDK